MPSAALPTFSCSVTCAIVGSTVAGLGQLAVGADTGLGMETPEEAVIRARHGRVRLRENELSFPSQGRAKILNIGVEAIADHAAPPAAFRMARLRATRASWTL